MIDKISLFRTILLTGALSLNVSAQAKEGDLNQPINVQADRSEFDEKAGTQTLSGNVEITQGTMRISAEEIAISLKDNALSSITGSGKPIRFQQENDVGEMLEGEAENVIYDAIAGTLTLEGSASLNQPRQKVISNLIVFDARSQKVLAEGGGKTGRVSIQILPPTGTGQ